MAVTTHAATAYILDSPEVGFEPTTNGLTVHCSTAELFRIGNAILAKSQISKQTFSITFSTFLPRGLNLFVAEATLKFPKTP